MAQRIVQRGAAGEMQPVDGERPQIELPASNRPVDRTLRVQSEIERHAADRELGGAPLAPHQRAETEFDIELVGPHLAKIVGAADHHRAQPKRRRRQQASFQFARDPHRRADHMGGFRLELRTELVPVDKIRPDQRGDERDDQSYRQSEQRRLHGVSS